MGLADSFNKMSSDIKAKKQIIISKHETWSDIADKYVKLKILTPINYLQ